MNSSIRRFLPTREDGCLRSAIALVVAGFVGCSIGGGLLYAATKPAQPDRAKAAEIVAKLRPGPNAQAMLFQQPELWPALDHLAPDSGGGMAGAIDKTLKIAKGDTLIALLTDAGATVNEAHQAVKALEQVYDPRRLRLGQELTLTFDASSVDADAAAAGEEAKPLLTAIRLDASQEKDVIVQRQGEEFVALEEVLQLSTGHELANGEIRSSLYVSAERAGVPRQVLHEMVRLFSYDVDFQRDLRQGDRFMVFYENQFAPDGTPIRPGDILAASMVVNGKELVYYRYTPPGGERADYFTPDGRSIRKALLRTPVDATRISSGFGRRTHPILGYTRMHRGVDFAAPTGTPVRSAGDGVVQKAGWGNGYGNYIVVRHNSTHSTLYAHLSRMRVKTGQRVSQGQVIGNVGATGMATGPHLHYEVHVSGKQVNPMTMTLPMTQELTGQAAKEFAVIRARTDRMIRGLAETQTVSLDEE